MLYQLRQALARKLFGAALRLAGSTAAVGHPGQFYTCRGKGGLYSIVGISIGAGSSKGQRMVVYHDIALPADKLYHRTVSDFEKRMDPA